ncbi:hypothetical protein BP5796_12892 [Coleophoma crateriformis]|uniref:Uncharacterized protein n=1 Tax=Coleophoma crateriformis TaxID=565419 RepID=A0A3D8Q4Q9_9HELO|nr:hypothetical protein BP5796_12892 [Coleophoma crateriformis]
MTPVSNQALPVQAFEMCEITHVEHFIYTRLEVKDKAGKDYPTAFDLDPDGGDLDVDSFHVGRTIAILYASQHGFLESTEGIRPEDAGSARVGNEGNGLGGIANAIGLPNAAGGSAPP